MASRIVRLAPLRGPSAAQAAALRQAPSPPERLHAWSGASGRRYEHGVYSLLECPPLPQAVYLLVHRHDNGDLKVLYIAPALDDAPSLNLARIRQRGATLGANEVHAHLQATSAEACRTIACDLRAGLFGSLGAQPASPANAG
jgi:hypothetical protein